MPSHRIVLVAAALAAVVVSIVPFGLVAAPDPGGGELDRLAEAQLPVALDYKQVPVTTILEALGRVGHITFHGLETLPERPIDVHLPEGSLVQALRIVGTHGSVRYRILGPSDLEVSTVQVAGKNGVTYPRLVESAKVLPAYPEEARQQGLTGKVILETVVLRTGEVADIRVLRVVPADFEPFAEAAVAAVREWRYEPAMRSGEPVDCYFTIVVEFALTEDGTPAI